MMDMLIKRFSLEAEDKSFIYLDVSICYTIIKTRVLEGIKNA